MIDMPIDNTITASDLSFYEYKIAKGDALSACVIKSARQYKIHPDYIYTIAKQEAGTTGEYRQNESDGTHDVGQMQINYETWAREFLRLGFVVDWARVLFNLCDNVMVGTKIIELRQNGAKDAFTAMANYHWFSTAENNAPHFKYKKEIRVKWNRLQSEKAAFHRKFSTPNSPSRLARK